MAEFYFVTNRLDLMTKHCFIDGGYIVPALEEYRARNKYEPTYLIAGCQHEDGRIHLYDTEGKTGCGMQWKHMFAAYFVVRHNPGTPYPETVISEDGIFTTPWDADKYIKEHGGAWKVYDFRGLQEKMAESLEIEAQLKRIKDSNPPW